MGINFQNVNFSYQTPKRRKKIKYVLKDINLTISEKNEFIALLGHTGSGKSTIAQIMNALLLPTTGSVTAFSEPISIKNKKLKKIRKRVGLVFQFPEYQLFEETVLKDVAFGPKNFGKSNEEAILEAKKALDLVGLDSEYYYKSPFSLSGGQMRKVAIAGILASLPDILIFDEPTVGLDPTAKKELLSLLKKINDDGKSIIIITHDMDVVSMVCKRAIVLDDGNIVYDGDVKNLFKSDIIEKHSLDYPNIVKIMMKLKEETKLPIDVYQFTSIDAYNEILRVVK